MTEGTQFTEKINVYNTGDCNNCGGQPCNYCWHQGSPPSGHCSAGIGTGHVELYDTCYNAPLLIAHESGHAFLSLPDEYYNGDFSAVQCTHSVMGTSGAGNSNHLCYFLENDHQDHNMDPSAPGIPPSTAPAAWTALYNGGLAPSLKIETPDNHLYKHHGFASLMAQLIYN